MRLSKKLEKELKRWVRYEDPDISTLRYVALIGIILMIIFSIISFELFVVDQSIGWKNIWDFLVETTVAIGRVIDNVTVLLGGG